MTNAEIIRELYESFGKGDVAAVLGGLDPSLEWDEAEGFMYGGRYYGPNGVLEGIFKRYGTEWEGFTVAPEQLIDGGDGFVVALGKYSGKYLATEKSVTVPFAHVWELRDGKVVKFRQFTDTLVIARELGL